MKKKVIKIDNIHDAIELVHRALSIEGDINISRGAKCVDGKSILGVISIDMSEGVTIEYPETEVEFDKYLSQYE